HPDMIPSLTRYGVPEDRITASGIPVHSIFSRSAPTAPIFKQLELDPKKRVVLVLAGGLGLQSLLKAVENLFQLTSVQLITVSGKNEALRQQLTRLQAPIGMKVVHLGFVKNMHELLSIADLVITKPGGLTVTECVVKKRPMIFFDPIPGQEEANAE